MEADQNLPTTHILPKLIAVQVEPSPPLPETPQAQPEATAGGSAEDSYRVLEAMVLYFFRLTLQGSFDEEMVKRIVSKTFLPLTEQFDKAKVAHVFSRYQPEKFWKTVMTTTTTTTTTKKGKKKLNKGPLF